MRIASIGIDLGKSTFHLVALGEHSKVVVRKKFSRTQLLAYTANLPCSLIGLEACAGAHFMGAALREQGHEMRLIPAQFVKPYRKSNKNDFIDGEAIAEAVTKQNMRFVQIKTQEQLDVQALHRVRDRLVQRRTALINEIRGFLLERGITFPAQPIHLRKNLAHGGGRCRAEPDLSSALAARSAVAGVEADRDRHPDHHGRDRAHQ
jgi:transposase